MLDVKGREIVFDARHHLVDGKGAHDRQPTLFRHIDKRWPMLFGERFANRLQVVARIKPFRNGADVVAKRFAISQKRRFCQHVNLPASVVDVVFARHVKACELQQIGQHIAEHRAPAMPNMHRAGWIGRDVFEIDLLTFARTASCELISLLQNAVHQGVPDLRLEGDVEESRTRDVDFRDIRQSFEFGFQRLRDIARFHLRGLREHQRGIGRNIAMRRIARRFGFNGGDREIGRQLAFSFESFKRTSNSCLDVCKNVHKWSLGRWNSLSPPLRGERARVRGGKITGANCRPSHVMSKTCLTAWPSPH